MGSSLGASHPDAFIRGITRAGPCQKNMEIAGCPAQKTGMWKRERLLDQLPQRVTLEVTREAFRGRYPCRLAAARDEFLTLEGLRSEDKAFFLPLGSSI